MATHYVTATDITPTRCTITGSYTRRDKAEAAVDQDDMARVFTAVKALSRGVRAYHLDGKAWTPNPAAVALGRRGGSANTAAQLAQRQAAAKHGGRPKLPLPCLRCGTLTLDRKRTRADCGC